jgi:hypothetical protein
MTDVSEAAIGGMMTGFQAQVFLWVWCGVVVLYALVRSFARPEPDAIRPSGPID